MTLKEYIFAVVARNRQQLLDTFLAVPDDKLTWKPFDNGRSALELFADVANTFEMAAAFIASKGEEKPSMEKFAAMRAISSCWNKEQALAAMENNFAAYAQAWDEITDEDLQKPITMPFGGGTTLPMAMWANLPNRTCTARFAQINYIQTLYGDFEAH